MNTPVDGDYKVNERVAKNILFVSYAMHALSMHVIEWNACLKGTEAMALEAGAQVCGLQQG